MNKDKMELEEAIKILKDDNKVYKLNKLLNDTLNIECPKYYQAIEVVLEALTDAQKQYQEGYLRGRKEEEKEMLKVIKMHYIERKKIEKLIDNLYADDNTTYGTIRIIEMLQELLEDK